MSQTKAIRGGTRVHLPERSVLRIDGYAADVALHALPPVSTDRVSLTFRKLTPEAKVTLLRFVDPWQQAGFSAKSEKIDEQ